MLTLLILIDNLLNCVGPAYLVAIVDDPAKNLLDFSLRSKYGMAKKLSL
jgi:hypothetical protein